MNSFGDAWELICSYCKTKITDVAYNTWIVRIKPLELDFDDNTAYLIVPNDFHRQTITRCYIPLLNEAFEAIFDNKFKIALKTPAEVEQSVRFFSTATRAWEKRTCCSRSRTRSKRTIPTKTSVTSRSTTSSMRWSSR